MFRAGRKFRFQNPLRQNHRHVKALEAPLAGTSGKCLMCGKDMVRLTKSRGPTAGHTLSQSPLGKVTQQLGTFTASPPRAVSL